MFDNLSDKFDGIFKKLRGKGRLSEADIDEVMREVRVALLEADVNIKVVRGFVERVKARTLGTDLSKALNPAQQVIKYVHEELIAALGGEGLKITYESRPDVDYRSKKLISDRLVNESQPLTRVF